MITSFFDGRLRLRDEALKDKANMALVTGLLSGRDGVLRLEPNARTGSLLIEYDQEKISRETLLQAGIILESQLAAAKPAKTVRAKKAKCSPFSPAQESLLLCALYALTAVTGFGPKRLHVLLGTGFAVLAGMHLYDRKHLLK